MGLPPPGYDDESVIPKKRLKLQLDAFEDELVKMSSVFQQHLPGQFETPTSFDSEFWQLRHSAEELGSEYNFLVEKLISDYQNFKKSPDLGKLEQLFSDIKVIDLLLIG